MPSHDIQPPCRLCDTALMLRRSCSVLVTSATTMALCSSLEAFDQKRGVLPLPRPAQPSWTLPTTSWCFGLLIAMSTSSWAFHFLPARIWEPAALTSWSVDSLSSSTIRAFSCLYPRLMDLSGSCSVFLPKRPMSDRHLGSPSHFLMIEFASLSILSARRGLHSSLEATSPLGTVWTGNSILCTCWGAGSDWSWPGHLRAASSLFPPSACQRALPCRFNPGYGQVDLPARGSPCRLWQRWCGRFWPLSWGQTARFGRFDLHPGPANKLINPPQQPRCTCCCLEDGGYVVTIASHWW